MANMVDYKYELSGSHFSEVLLYMEGRRSDADNVLCDLCFIVPQGRVYAHRCVLAACSAYFQGMFSGAFAESLSAHSSSIMEIDLSETCTEISHLEVLISCLYTGQLILKPDSISGVLNLACYLLLEPVRDLCVRYLLETFSLQTCVLYMTLADKHSLSLVLSRAKEMIAARFHDYFIHQREMWSVSSSCLQQLGPLFGYVHLQPFMQFLLHWIEGMPRDTYAVSSENVKSYYCKSAKVSKSERTQTATTILKSYCQIVHQAYFNSDSHLYFSPLLLTGPVETIKALEEVVLQEIKVGLTADGNTVELEKSSDITECKELAQLVDKNISDIVDGGRRDQICKTDAQVTATVYNQTENVNTAIDSEVGIPTHQIYNVADAEDDDSFLKSPSTLNEENNICALGVMSDSSYPSTSTELEQCVSENGALSAKICGERISDFSIQLKSSSHTLIENATDAACTMLFALVPSKKTVAYITAVDCMANRPRHCDAELEVCLYHIKYRQWLHAGTTIFPDILEEKSCWRAACLYHTAYFVSLPKRIMLTLDLTTLTWGKIDCSAVFQDLVSEVRSVVPIVVNGHLYVLVSDKIKLTGNSSMYMTQQRYLRLEADGSWKVIADVQHEHTSTPLSNLSVSGDRVYVIKADITLTMEKSLLVIKEGHIFHANTGEIVKFHGITFAPSPMRVLVHNEILYIVDGDGWSRCLRPDQQLWDSLEKVDLSDIRWCRAASDHVHFPCLTNISAAMGASVWEFAGFLEHNSALSELTVGHEGKITTIQHPPPPFHFMTALTVGQVSLEVVSCLKPCFYLHS